MEIYKEKGKTGRVYHVLEPNEYPLEGMIQAARYHKTNLDNMRFRTVYIKDDELYLEFVEGARATTAIVRK